MHSARIPFRRPLTAALVLTAAVGLAGVAQPPGGRTGDQPGGKQAGPKEGQTKYQAQLISVRPDADRVVFRVNKDGSQRIYSLLLADQAKVRAGGRDAGLDALKPAAMVTVTTERRGGLERVVTITTGDPGAEPRPKGPADRDGDPTGGKVSLAFPTGDRASSVLLIETNAPDEVRVGEAYDYRIKVTNISKNLMLENVVVRQVASEKLDVRAAGEQPAGKGQGAKDGKNPDGKTNPGGQPPDQQADEGGGNVRWTVPALAPGESATLRAPAAAHAEGTVGSCFRVTYQPALCVRIRAVKPDIQLTKAAPPEVRFCDAFAFKYTVTNSGSAAARGVVITDDLPDGLATNQKTQRQARFEVGDLKPGETKEFTAPVLAAGRGEYSSRATAKTAGGLSVQSKTTTTRVREAELTVELSGPASGYVQQSATYTVKVKNDGDAPAPGSRLEVQLDPNTRFVRAGRATRLGAEAGNPVQPGQGKEGVEPPAPDKDRRLSWDLGTVQPGETRQATFTVTGRQQGTLKTVAVARFACDRAKDDNDLAVARRTLQTEMLVVPALRLSLVDQSDLIRVGDTVTYTLRVTNQGTGPDKKVAVKLHLPEELEYVDAVGPSNGNLDKRVITFDGVDQLAPGQTLTWNIRAKATKDGDVRTTAELGSEYLDSPVTTTEPTRLVK